MTELEKLLKQKQEIELKIKMLKNQAVSFGSVKIDLEHYPTQKPDEWGLYVRREVHGLERRSEWKSISRSVDKNEVVDDIDKFVDDLLNLKKMLKEE